jgi:hypothetical protein
MRRRQFLASGTALLAGAVAGCAHPDVVLDLEAADASDVASEVSIAPDPESEEYRVVASAVENGSATRSGRGELFDDGETVRVGDAFYEVSETRTEQNEVTVYAVRIDFDPADTTADLGEIAFEDLPEADRERLGRLVSEEDPPDGEGYDVGVGYGTAEEAGDSVFVPEQQYDILVYEGNRYRVGVESRPAESGEYRYEVTERAGSVEAFADQVRDRYLFTLSGLSEAEREVVEASIDGAHFEDTDAFRSVVDRLRDHEGIDVQDFYGTWLLEYESDEYIAYAEW